MSLDLVFDGSGSKEDGLQDVMMKAFTAALQGRPTVYQYFSAIGCYRVLLHTHACMLMSASENDWIDRASPKENRKLVQGH